MHRDWLGELYDWAGQYRTVKLSKGGFTWPPAYLVPKNLAAFEAEQIAVHTPCPPAPLEEVARRIAEVHAELLLIHPFREGNGRLARWLAGLTALQARLPTPAYRFEGRGAKAERERYLNSVVRGYYRDYEPLAAFFDDALARGLREAL